jgi:hypothetical protein
VALAACLLFSATWLPADGEYSHDFLPDGTPRFTQVLRWDGDPNALFYQVTLQTGAEEEVSVAKVTEPVLRLNLAPGQYRYRIAFYNLLGKREITLPWQGFEVLKAEVPSVTRCAPKVWFLEEPKHVLTLQGEDIRPGATFVLKGDATSQPRIAGTEQEREGTSTARVSFPSDALVAGEYVLEVTNPGGLSAVLPHALLARHMLPAATGLSPASGSTFGPKELRGARSIRFSWEPVQEATRYSFCLYRDGDANPTLRRDSLEDCACALDFALLDRGDFRWTVEAQGTHTDGTAIPAMNVAEARFRIELPRISVPSRKAGDTFYGR